MMIERNVELLETDIEKVIKSVDGKMALRLVCVGPITTVSAQILSGSTIGYLGNEFLIEDLIRLGQTLAQHQQALETEDEQNLVD